MANAFLGQGSNYVGFGGASDASEVAYDNSQSSLTADNVQDAIDEVKGGLPFRLGIDSNGNYGYYKAGADSVTPFRSALPDIVLYNNGSYDPSLFNTNIISPPGVTNVTTGYSINSNDIELRAQRTVEGAAEVNFFHVSSLPLPKGYRIFLVSYWHRATIVEWGNSAIHIAVGNSYQQTNSYVNNNLVLDFGDGGASSQRINYYNSSYYRAIEGFVLVSHPENDNYLMFGLRTHNISSNKINIKSIRAIG